MSLKHNPALIGGFMLGGLILTIAGALYFGSFKVFADTENLVVLFDESVNGLEIGAPVKIRGIKVGQVKQILLRVPGMPDDSESIAVKISIDRPVIRNLGGGHHLDGDLAFESVCQMMVEQGLRAQLQLQSLITGQYFIDLKFSADSSPPEYRISPGAGSCPEIPAVPSPFARFEKSANQLLGEVSALRLGELSAQLSDVLVSINHFMSSTDAGSLSSNLVQTLTTAREAMQDDTLREAISEGQLAIHEFRLLTTRIGSQVEPVSTELKETLVQMQETLGEVETTSRRAHLVLSEDSAMRYRLEKALENLAGAAAAFQRLSEELERNPNMLITGKAQEAPAP